MFNTKANVALCACLTRSLFWILSLLFSYQSTVLAQSGLSIGFNSIGLSSIIYNGTQFLDYGDLRLDQVTFLNPDQSTTAGSITSTVTVDSVGQVQTRTYSWGTIAIAYTVASANRLNFTVTVTNRSSLPIQQIWFETLGLHLPSAAVNYDSVDPLLGNTVGQTAIESLNFSSGVLVAAVDDVTKPLQIGFPYAFNRPTNTNFPLTVNTGSVSSYPDSLPFIKRPIAAGASDQYHFSFRFGPSGSTPMTLAADVYQGFAAAYPPTLNWPDRRLIGQIVIATSAAGYALNPRGWFLNPYEDVTTPAGVAQFQTDLLTFAATSVGILKSMNAQGMVTWDIEGEQYPHPSTYNGDPRQFATLAPEMAGVADQYFAIFRNAGLKVGVTIRPQNLVVSADGKTAQQIPLTDPTQLLIDKATYAHTRWGATLFYIDSNVNATDPNPIDPGIIRTLSVMFPDSLFIPEHSNTQYYAYSAPYLELRQNFTATPADAKFTYPNGFSVLYTADGPLAQDYNALVTSVSQGDVLMYRTWFPDPQNAQVLNIYNAAHTGAAITVAITPQSGTLSAGQTFPFGASVIGSTNQQVTWSTTLGSVSTTGLYTAPASVSAPQVATVTATSQADPTKSATASLTVNPVAVPITISITPQTGTVVANQTLQFTAAVIGSANQQVTWTATIGSISASGLYTAPSLSSSQTAAITATSQADSTKSATASVTINPPPVPITVAVNPQSGTLTANQTLQFSAAVSGSSNQQITWTTTLGSISSNGLYTAPTVSSAQTATVTATSQADPTKSAAASVTVNPAPVPVNVTVTPQSGTLTANQTLQFSAAVSGSTNQQVTWTTTLGSISSSGFYTAPSVSSSQTATIKATSLADPTKSATASLILNPPPVPISVTVTPQSGTLTANQTLQFSAAVTGSANQLVAWTTTLGSISSAGLYTAPAVVSTNQTATILATSAADPTKSAAATVTITPPAVPSCGAPSLNAFTGCYYQDRSFGVLGFSRIDPQINFNWTATPPGNGVGPDNFTIRWTGYFTFQASSYAFTVASDDGSRLFIDGVLAIENWGEHPAIPATATIPLTAGSHLIQLDYEQLSGAASTALSWAALSSVTVAPTAAALVPGQSVQFTSSAPGLTSQQVVWSVTPAGLGTVSSTGLYSAPATLPSAQTATVTATSVSDPTKFASATVSISAAVVQVIGVSLSPQTASLAPGQSQQLTATVSGTANQQVSWSINPPGVGTVSSSGLYTGPAIVAGTQTVTVTATSASDPTRFATALLTITPQIAVAACGTPSTNAFTGCYFQDRSFSVLAFTRVDPQINFVWQGSPGPGIGSDNFSIRWLGTFSFSAANYVFTLATDDGSRLWIDGNLVLDVFSEHPAIPYTVTVPLQAGTHLIQVDYFQLGGAASASLTWNPQP